jgi:hypothetical protein
MRFSLFPRLFLCISCIWVPNMASLLGPIIYFQHGDVQGGVLKILHTHLGIIFPKVLPMFTSHYSISYSLGIISLQENILFSSHFSLIN